MLASGRLELSRQLPKSGASTSPASLSGVSGVVMVRGEDHQAVSVEGGAGGRVGEPRVAERHGERGALLAAMLGRSPDVEDVIEAALREGGQLGVQIDGAARHAASAERGADLLVEAAPGQEEPVVADSRKQVESRRQREPRDGDVAALVAHAYALVADG